jgi:hypothetical protein
MLISKMNEIQRNREIQSPPGLHAAVFFSKQWQRGQNYRRRHIGVKQCNFAD